MVSAQQADVSGSIDHRKQTETTSFFAHSTAVIEPNSKIGAGSKIWHHSHVRADALIGADCVIGKNVFIDAHVTIGNGCKIQNNVSVYHGVSLGNHVFVGPSVTFTNDRIPRAFNTTWKITPTAVGDGASIGANATIVCGTTIGSFAMVAAGATVIRDVAPNQLVVGTPAAHMGWVCTCGKVVSREVEAPHDIWCGECDPRDLS